MLVQYCKSKCVISDFKYVCDFYFPYEKNILREKYSFGKY